MYKIIFLIILSQGLWDPEHKVNFNLTWLIFHKICKMFHFFLLNYFIYD